MALGRWWSLCGLTMLLGAGGCAGGSAVRRADELRRLRAQLVTLRTERSTQAETITELRNRIFILEDRVDTNHVEASRELPVVRLAPVGPAPVAEAEAAPEGEAQPEDETWQEPEEGPRPVLRLHERGSYAGAAVAPGGSPRAPLRPMASSELGSQDALPVVTMEGIPAPGSSRAAPRAPAAAQPPSESLSGQDASGEALASYESAFALFRARRFDEAIAAFASFRSRYPQHSYADNALYWRGECFYAKRDYRAALGEFEAVYSRYPGGNKAPDAMLKAAYSRAELGDHARARATLLRLVELFPRSDAARLAAERAARLAAAGEVRQ